MERDALNWLHSNVDKFEEIPADDAESQLIVTSTDHSVKSLEAFQSAPNRIKSRAALLSTTSFVEYVNRFKGEDTTVYMDAPDMSFEAVLDHHGADKPSWGDHAARFICKESLEWQAWKSTAGVKITQIELAEFIEQQLDDITTPDPNVMLQAALAFEANEKMALASSINLDNGNTKFNFVKENVNKSVTFPHRLTIYIPLIENEKRRAIDLRVRYRSTSEGVLTFVLSFVKDPSNLVRDAMLRISDDIVAGCEDVVVYEGGVSPEFSTRRR